MGEEDKRERGEPFSFIELSPTLVSLSRLDFFARDGPRRTLNEPQEPIRGSETIT